MGFQFDHFVHFVNSPEEAMAVYRELGLFAVEGGRHENLGTYNGLSYFGLSYVELIGAFDKSLLENAAGIEYSLRETIVKGHYTEGPIRIALRTKDLQAEADRFRSLGLEVYGPSDYSRKRPDGSLVKWKLLHAGKRDEALDLPFFIQWDESDEERIADLTARGTMADHPIGEVSLNSVGFAVNSIEEITERWTKYLQLEAGESYVDESLNAKAQVLTLQGGNIVLYEPLGKGKVKEVLETRGEKLFLLEFKTTSMEKDVEVFNATYRFTK